MSSREDFLRLCLEAVVQSKGGIYMLSSMSQQGVWCSGMLT